MTLYFLYYLINRKLSTYDEVIILKYRESGMPDETMWDTFFNPTDVLDKMNINNEVEVLVDIGCGYGTFLISMAERVKEAIGIDIDDHMISICKSKINDNNIKNIELLNGDISTAKTLNELEKYKCSVDYISLFNILHCEEPKELLENISRLLKDTGKIGIIHWKCEETPRGPSMEIRPNPEMIIDWASKTGFKLQKKVELPPYHFGLIFSKVL